MRNISLAATLLALVFALGGDHAAALNRPVTLEDQGSFFAGGAVLQNTGDFDFSHPLDQTGQTIHGDHAYVFWQKPINARKYPLIFLHGGGQSARTWETTPDGRDGFQNIFLSRGYATYLVDQPRRGKAGQSTRAGCDAVANLDQFWFSNFRLGIWPEFFEGVQFAVRSEEALEQFLRQMTPNTGAYDPAAVVGAMVRVFEKSGDGILVTHSQSGGIGWLAAMKSPRVKAVISLEPGSAFVFPEGEAPMPVATSSPFGQLKAETAPIEEFMKLARIPILIIYGDNIAKEYTSVWNKDTWRIRLDMARKWAAAVNARGGDVQVAYLPDAGIKGNTHFIMSDLNNEEIADMIEKWLREKKLTDLSKQ